MQYVPASILRLLLASTPEDDVDRLFEKLGKVEPPKDTVKEILARIRQLPESQRYPRPPASPEKDKPASKQKPEKESDKD